MSTPKATVRQKKACIRNVRAVPGTAIRSSIRASFCVVFVEAGQVVKALGGKECQVHRGAHGGGGESLHAMLGAVILVAGFGVSRFGDGRGERFRAVSDGGLDEGLEREEPLVSVAWL